MEAVLAGAIADALARLGVDADSSRFGLERPAHPDHGDWSTNAALVNAKAAGMAPRDLAQRLADDLGRADLPHLDRTEVAGPGFVNVHLAPSWLHDVLATVLQDGADGYARLDVGSGQTVNLEFVSANPTGPLHAGGGRWGAFGDSLARLFRRCGYETVTEYYVNDLGRQVQLFGQSLVARMTGRPVPDDGYHGEYVGDFGEDLRQGKYPKEWAEQLASELRVDGDVERAEALEASARGSGMWPMPGLLPPGERLAARWGIKRALRDVSESLAAMNVSFDHWQYETKIVEPDPGDPTAPMSEVLRLLHDCGATFGEDGATWLETSKFGDSKDRVLVRSNQEPTYFLPDIAYHHAKFDLGRFRRLQRREVPADGDPHGRDEDHDNVDLVIDVLGADHHGYVPRIAAAMQMLGHPAESYEAIVGQNVTLMRDGQVIELSKRTGTMVEVRELIDAVGPDVARFAFLLQSIDSRQTIDIDLLSAQASENPVFYVQYAHARIASVARRAESDGVAPVPPPETDLSPLDGDRELALLRALEVLPSVVEIALRERAPHKVTTWVRDLAAAFHGFYHDCPILHSDNSPEVRDARLCLTEGTRIGLAIGLDLLGVAAPEAM